MVRFSTRKSSRLWLVISSKAKPIGVHSIRRSILFWIFRTEIGAVKFGTHWDPQCRRQKLGWCTSNTRISSSLFLQETLNSKARTNTHEEDSWARMLTNLPRIIKPFPLYNMDPFFSLTDHISAHKTQKNQPNTPNKTAMSCRGLRYASVSWIHLPRDVLCNHTILSLLNLKLQFMVQLSYSMMNVTWVIDASFWRSDNGEKGIVYWGSAKQISVHSRFLI